MKKIERNNINSIDLIYMAITIKTRVRNPGYSYPAIFEGLCHS
jgi:hypothetical protein